MTEIVFATPVERGKEDLDRQMRDEMTGARREEYEAALKEAGVTRQAVWHQQQPDGGTLAIVYIEASDPDAHQRFVSSDTEISRWFVEQMQGVHGRDVSQPPLPVEHVLDFRV
jgi:LmbE family N-acetylglucosaminyl deacetylase